MPLHANWPPLPNRRRASALALVSSALGALVASAAVASELKVEASMIGVVQRIDAGGPAEERGRTRSNFRGDLVGELPIGAFGDARGKAIVHLRTGTGAGVSAGPTYTGTVNSSGFDPGGGGKDQYAIVAQAYYQLIWPLSAGPGEPPRGDRIGLTLGKLDPFGFFDRNTLAEDEAKQFLNNVFVHNPLLDSGGDVAADTFGFAPGMTAAYSSGSEGGWRWGASLGVFGAGIGDKASFARPLTIARIQASPIGANGRSTGTYRFYVWTNGGTVGLDDARQRHSGFGMSVNQRIAGDLRLFGRYGRRTSGEGAFDHGVTFGAQYGGRAWGRTGDVIGIAFGRLGTDPAWKAATADGTLTGYAATGSERVAEVYYRIAITERLSISPDLQLIRRPGGDGGASTVRVFGIRTVLEF